MSAKNPFGKPKNTEPEDDDFSLDDVVEGGSNFLFPDGDYRARVIDVVKETSKAGNAMWVWTFLIMQGDEGGLGKEVKCWTALTPAAMWKLTEVLKAIGIAVVDGKVRAKRADLVGKECAITCVAEEYNGSESSKIQKCTHLDELPISGPTYSKGSAKPKV